MSDEPKEPGLGKVRAGMLSRVVTAARDLGAHEGGAAAYKDVLAEIHKALENAEDELTRIPPERADLVMGEIMALRRLAAHFAPAPAFHEHRIEQFTEAIQRFVERLLSSAQEGLAQEETRQ